MRQLFLLISLILLNGCGGDSEKFNSNCKESNELQKLIVNGETIDFKPTAFFAYKNDMMSYRLIITNYPQEEFKGFSALADGQIKLEIGIFDPEGDEYKPGEYTYKGNSNNKNRALFSLTMGDMRYYHQVSTGEPMDYGKIVITHVDENGMCGTAHLKGIKDNEVKLSFNVENVNKK